MNIPGRVTILMAAVIALVVVKDAAAAWSRDAEENLPVFRGQTATPDAPVVVRDGKGGAVVVWVDARSGLSLDLFAQHVRGAGSVDPRWPADGLPIATTDADELAPAGLEDGNGGILVAWYRQGLCTGPPGDPSSCFNSIRVKRLMLSGVADPSWPEGGVTVSTVDGFPFDAPRIVSDGAGGILVAYDAWGDWEPSLLRFKFLGLRVQHVLGSGVADPTWPRGGRRVSPGVQGPLDLPGEILADLVSDDHGGAIVAWTGKGPAVPALSVQRILSSSEIDSRWPADGLSVLDSSFGVNRPELVSDGSGGAIIAWTDYRDPSTATDIFAHHVLEGGTVDPAWPTSGLAVCTAPLLQQYQALTSDRRGGAFIAWEDSRNGLTDVFGQDIEGTGSLAWPAAADPICLAPGYQNAPALVSDEAGGVVVVWQDFRNAPPFGSPLPYGDLYAQHVLRSGIADPSWPVNGRAVTTAPGLQGPFGAVTDDQGGVVVIWRDERNGAGDLYAQRVTRHGELGDNRSAAASSLSGDDPTFPGRLDFAPPSPNPARGSVALEYRIPQRSSVRLTIYDSFGRVVRKLSDSEQEMGLHVVAWDFRDDATREVPSGLYFARLRTAQGEVVKRLVKL